MKTVAQVYGQSMAFPPQVGEDGRIQWSSGPVNIRESIEIILKTELGERIYLPDFGGGLRPLGLVDLVRLIWHHDVTPRGPRDLRACLSPVGRQQAPTIEITVKTCAGASDNCPTSGLFQGLGQGPRA